MTILVNCVLLHLSLTQTFYKFFMMKRITKSRKTSKKWIRNLKKINIDESMCHTHTQDHQLYTFGIAFFTTKHAWNMSAICILYVVKVEKEAKQSSLLLQKTVKITMPTATII